MSIRWSSLIRGLAIGLWLCAYAVTVSAQRIPEPIDEREVEQYAKLVDLTEDQRAIARSIWAQYMEDYHAGPLERIRAVNARETEAVYEIQDRAKLNNENPGALAKELYPPIIADMARLAAEAREFEERNFFDNLASILTEEQLPRMKRVRLRRELVIASRYIHLFELPEGKVNLLTQLDALTLPGDVHASLELEFVPWYESRLLDLLRSSAAARWQRDIRAWDADEVQWTMRQRPQNVNDPVMQELLKEYFKIRSEAGESMVVARRQVVEHNRAALAQLRELLPPDAFAILQDRIRRTSYPKIWPDDGSVERLFDAVLAREDLANDLRTGIAELRSAWAQQHEMLSLDMAEQRMQEWIGGQRGSKEAQRDGTRARKELEAIGHRREALNRYQQELLEKMLSPEMLAELPLRDWENDPPVRPWDPTDVSRRMKAERIADREAYEERAKQMREEFDRRKREEEQGKGGDGQGEGDGG